MIAGIAKRLRDEHPGLRLCIISKDKDLKQLLADGEDHSVELFDIHTDAVIDGRRVEGGHRPCAGPGRRHARVDGRHRRQRPRCAGVGPKTAAQLIALYGTLENLLARAEEIKERGEAIRAARARQARWC